MKSESSASLNALASGHGLQSSYVDITGATRQAPAEVLARVVAALGEPAQTASGLPPVCVAWDGNGELPVAPKRAGRFRLELTDEDGQVSASEGELDGPGAIALPPAIPTGYHRARVLGVGIDDAEAMIVCAPRRVFVPEDKPGRRAWGVFAPLYALRSEGGFASLGELRRLTEFVSRAGGDVVGTLPLLAAFLDDPCDPSPYTPASRLAWNELFLELEPRTQDPGRSLLDYRSLAAARRKILEPLARKGWEQQRAELESFGKLRPELADYARFRGAMKRLGSDWRRWPAGPRQGSLRDEQVDRDTARYHLFAQWALDRQLGDLAAAASSNSVGLYLDLPIGVHPNGYDVWRHQELFVRGLSTGAPPDLLFSGGQNWAFAPLHPRLLRRSGYAHLIAVIRNHLRYAKVLRIDHVMGLHRLYVIPDGFAATQGVYLSYEPEELYAILSVESHRAGALLIGENLGTVPPEVTDAMTQHGVHGMHVLQYAARPWAHDAIPPTPSASIATLNTHDMPPFAAYWSGADIDARRELGLTDDAQAMDEHRERDRFRDALRSFINVRESSESVQAFLRHLGRSDAKLVLCNLEDLWFETLPQNIPGTNDEHPNWRRRMKLSLEELDEDEFVQSTLRALSEARKMSANRGVVRYDVTRLTDDDLHWLGEGTHEQLHDKLGAHTMEDGTYFAVWAPSADFVSVVGDFNDWDPGRSPLQARGHSGVWEGLVVGVGCGDLYKYHVAKPGFAAQKLDPYATSLELPPRTAAVVTDLAYTWGDSDWIASRAQRNTLAEPMSIYEVHLGSWRRVPEEGDRMLTYEEAGRALADYASEMGFTHVELMPVMEHPFYGSWGYQVTGYFAPTARHGHPRGLMAMIDHLHQRGIGVILDWVPSHFPSDDHALARFDGTHLYEHADPRLGYHPDWRSCIFNYGRHEVRSFLISNALSWIERYHADGLRVDGVASMLYRDYSREDGEWLPNKYGGKENLEAIDFLRGLNEAVYRRFPGVETIAEESTSWPMVSRPTYVGGLGFGLKWDMGWMHDTLRYLEREPIHRRFHQSELTFRMIYAFAENFVLSLSHDEVVHGKGSLLGKMPGDTWQRFANLRALYGYMWGQPGKKLLFMGQEFGHGREWHHDRSLDWHLLGDPQHEGVRRLVADLNRLHKREPALHERDSRHDGFGWIACADAEHSVFAFARFAHSGRPIVVVCNFTPVVRTGYRVGLPRGGEWAELLNTDAHEYGGSGVGNGGRVFAEAVSANEQAFSAALTLPPLGVLYLGAES